MSANTGGLARLGSDNIRPQPASERTMGFYGTFSLWFGANMVVTTVLTGTLMVPDLPLGKALLAIFLGTAIGLIPLTAVATMGTITGMPTMAVTRGAFGTKGGHVASVINIVTLIGWAWIQALLAGMSLNYAVKYITGYDNLALFTILCESIVVLVAIYGHRGVEWFERIVSTAMLLMLAAVLYKIVTTFDLHTHLAYTPDPTVHGTTMAIAFDIAVATAISWASSSADFNRNCPNQITSWLGTGIGYMCSTMVAMGMGALVGALSIVTMKEMTYDPTVLLAKFGFGLVAALVIFASVLTTNLLAVYSATMSFLNIFPRVQFWKPALGIGVITIVGALWSGLLDSFMNWILLIGTIFMPMFGIVIADFYILKKRHYETQDLLDDRPGSRYYYYKGWNVVALACYFVSAFMAYYWSKIHPLSFGSTIVSFLLSVALYLGAAGLFCRRGSVNERPSTRPGAKEAVPDA